MIHGDLTSSNIMLTVINMTIMMIIMIIMIIIIYNDNNYENLT